MKSIRELSVRHQLVFVRVDFNVPLKKNEETGEMRITEDARIKAALTTIEWLIQHQARVVLASHLGRPKGKVVPEMRLAPVAKRLGDYLGQEVHYIDDCVGPEVDKAKAALKDGEVLLLENLRFHKGEKKNDIAFAQELAKDVDVYIQEAFGAIHRKHASTYGVPSLIFDKAHGFLIQEELDALSRVSRNPDQPMVMVVGGMKISDKVGVIRNLAPLGDCVLIGGGVANAFMKGQGVAIGKSLVESDDAVVEGQDAVDYGQVAADIMNRFASEQPALGVTMPDGSALPKIVTPLDFIAAPSLDTPADETIVIEVGDGADSIPDDYMFLDIGPKTRALYAEILGKAKTVFWNGPMGVFEKEPFANGSKEIAGAIADGNAYAVLGGGDTESVVEHFGFSGRYAHVSTGGGASLTYLADGELPGLQALE